MKGLLITLTTILGVAVVGAAVYVFMLTGERDELQVELAATQATLALTQQELNITKNSLVVTENELAVTQDSLDSTRAELSASEATLNITQMQLASTEDELKATEDELSATEADLDVTKTQLTAATLQIDNAEDELEELEEQYQIAIETLHGLDITLLASEECLDAELINNPGAENPTWAELKSFLVNDKTEQHEYILDEYDCSQFSRDLHNRAEAAGIRAAEVQISLVGEAVGHALNAFLTTDYGLVYVDCTEAPDKIARVKTPKSFRAVALQDVSIAYVRSDAWWSSVWLYYYIPSGTGGEARVESITIFW